MAGFWVNLGEQWGEVWRLGVVLGDWKRKKDALLIFSEKKRRGLDGGDRALMRASLWDAQNSQTLSFPLSFHSGIGRGSGEKEDRTERKENSDFGLWFAGGLSLLACSLTVF